MSQEGANGVVGVEFAVAGSTIEAVKFEVLLELREADKTFESGLAHLGDVLELHVVGDKGLDQFGVFVGEAQASAKLIGHADADVDVVVEADTVSGFRGGAEGGRLADVMKQDAPGEGGRNLGGKTLEHEQGVDPDVAFGMKLRGLRDAFHGGDFGKNFSEEAEFIEKFKRAAGGALSEQLG